MQSTANLPVIGLDLAKSVFQLHIVDVETGEIQRRQIKRAKLTEFFAKCPPSLVAMEACGTAHHWARAIGALGHRVKLLPGQHVKAFLLRDKTDAMDAQAIWVAAQQPHIKPVPVKTERQQTCMALHGMRRQLMKIRIMQTNALRGILAEFGITLPVGHVQLLKTIQGELAKAQQADLLSTDLVVSVQEQLKRIDALQEDIDHLGQRLRAMIREDRQMQAIQQIPGVGDLTASALVGSVGDFTTFRSGRQFASWVGLVPRQVGTGGKTQQLGISKRGDTYLRTLLIAGARSVIARTERSSWISRLLERCHYNVVVVALANKMARTAWAVLAKGATFDHVKWNSTESVNA
ncbi:MAG: IS110 family transposase [Burkholderiales bacterium]|jgi:transposase|uniref:IS110 family transposase n=2 Tax=Hydrogenophaga sp. TaxID=1904254 RepID=UPI002AB97CC5|nr:IS110 family transposase [Hydrogenophaga sp.]MDZ4143418.1 IS110 family transposase [Burkholderiales bacterium]MDZ4283789.1 IS110 family transposase [Hydrogenophaga sp.]